MTGSHVCKERQKENSPERQAEAKTQRVLAILRNLHHIRSVLSWFSTKYQFCTTFIMHHPSDMTPGSGSRPWLLWASLVAWQCRRHRSRGFGPWVRKISRGRKWQPIPILLAGKSQEQRNLMGYSPWSLKSVEHNLATKNNNVNKLFLITP